MKSLCWARGLKEFKVVGDVAMGAGDRDWVYPKTRPEGALANGPAGSR